MRSSLLFTLFASSFAALAAPSDLSQLGFCGAAVDSESLKAVNAKFASLPSVDRNATADAAAAATINVIWHIIEEGNTPKQGHIPEKIIINEMSVINQAFQGTGLSFRIVSAQRVLNPAWYRGASLGTQAQDNMKRALRVGGPAELNIYTVPLQDPKVNPKGLIGYATFPFQFNAKPWDDGVVIMHDTLIGGANPHYNLGKVLVHEIGHWVGLFHTFEGGCFEQDGGDGVADTPAENYPTTAQDYACVKKNTCSAPGDDPIHNHMDYTNEQCRNHFTPGQVNRIRQMMAQYRGVRI